MGDAPGRYEDSRWWRDHFSGLMCELWQSVVPCGEAVRDADFLQAACELPPGSAILDVPCGNGRVALELAGRGFRLTGVDISPALLAEARTQSARRGLSVEWIESDMRELPRTEEFDAAICWGDSFGYMDDDGNRQFLAAVNGALKSGAPWMMELRMVAEVLLPRLRSEESGEVNGIHVSIRRRYDAQQGRLAVDYALTRDGIAETRPASYRIHTCAELCAMLERAGFAVERLCGGAGEPFANGSDRLRIVSVKRRAAV